MTPDMNIKLNINIKYIKRKLLVQSRKFTLKHILRYPLTDYHVFYPRYLSFTYNYSMKQAKCVNELHGKQFKINISK